MLVGGLRDSPNHRPNLTNFRGINTMEFDFDTCNAKTWKWFDTCEYSTTYWQVNPKECSGGTGEFIKYFTTQVSNGTVLLGVTMDDPMMNLYQSFSMLMNEGIDVEELPVKSMFAFVIQKGAKDKTVLEKRRPQLSGITLSVRITETGKTIIVHAVLLGY